MSATAGVLFDLDGTLADTAPDLAAAVNALLKEEGRAPLPYEQIRPWVSWGAPRLVRLAFGEELAADELHSLRSRLLVFYEAGLCRHSRVFPDMLPVLDGLERAGLPWGIVTNKPGWLTEPLVAALGLSERAGTVISGDTLPYAKPHPMPLLHAARELGVARKHCLYVGDAARDIEAGRAAGMVAADRVFGDPGGLLNLAMDIARAGEGAA
ncbi:MAG: phosphoglycolate phosphatase [Gammaproteobacteria bacterium]